MSPLNELIIYLLGTNIKRRRERERKAYTGKREGRKLKAVMIRRENE